MILLLLLASCGKRTEFESHGLRKIHIELSSVGVAEFMRGAPQRIDPSGNVTMDGKQHAIRMEAAGNSTIREAKKSFDLHFVNGDPIHGAQQVRFATTIKDHSMLRALLAYEVAQGAGFSPPTIEPVFVYLNERALGLYFMLERIDEDYFNRRNISWSRLYQAEENADFTIDMGLRLERAFDSKPKPDNLEVIRKLVETTHFQSAAEFETQVFQMLDRTEMIRYLAFAHVLKHFDGFDKNYYFVQPKGMFPQLRILPWDFDLVWQKGNTSGANSGERENQLFARIAELPTVAAAIDARVNDLMTGGASVSTLQGRIAFWKERLRAAFNADPILGGQGKSIDVECVELETQIQAWYLEIQ